MYSARTNPLINQVLAWLDCASLPAGEYALIQYLDAQLPSWPIPESADGQLQLFRKHFLVMNALYELQRHFRQHNVRLHVDPLAIDLVSVPELNIQRDGYGSGRQDDANVSAAHCSGLQAESHNADARLADYYLNWENFCAADSAAVQDLLDSFWNRYYSQDQLQEARLVLQVEASADWSAIQLSYRRLAKQAHPDNGGDAHSFIRIRRAYEQLKTHYG